MKKLGTLFIGGALFDIGARAAGYETIWGIEKDDKIASVARLNGFPAITGDVINFDWSSLERPDHIHASPPCPNFSVAKAGAEETELDIEMARGICRALRHFKPDTFTLEQVPNYRNSKSFKQEIARALSDLGYWWDATNLNSADFGVPQTRGRMWVRASRGLLRGYPPPVKWKGWYEAIEDLIPSLPDSKFAPWQLARLPEEYKTFMIGNGTYSSPRDEYVPADTITANVNQKHLRAFVARGGNSNSDGYAVRGPEEPMTTVTATMEKMPSKAFVLDGQANTYGSKVTARGMEEPVFTVSASAGRRPARAFVVPGGNANSFSVRNADEPARTVESVNRTGNTPRAYVGRVVKLDIRCLGRFQTVPDDYKGLTVKINGNGVPCLMAQRIMETL